METLRYCSNTSAKLTLKTLICRVSVPLMCVCTFRYFQNSDVYASNEMDLSNLIVQ